MLVDAAIAIRCRMYNGVSYNVIQRKVRAYALSTHLQQNK